MATPTLEIQVKADIKQAAIGLQTLFDEFNSIGLISTSGAKKVQSAIDQMLGSVKGVAQTNFSGGFISSTTEIKKAADSLSTVGDTINEGLSGIGANVNIGVLLAAFDDGIKSAQDLQRQIEELHTALKVATDTSMIEQLSARLNQLVEQLGSLKVKTEVQVEKIDTSSLDNLQARLEALQKVKLNPNLDDGDLLRVNTLIEKTQEEISRLVQPKTIAVTADTTEAVKKVNDITARPVAIKTDTDITEAIRQLKQITQPVSITVDTSQGVVAVDKLTAVIDHLQADLASKRQEVNLQTDPGKITALKGQIEGLETEIIRLTTISDQATAALSRIGSVDTSRLDVLKNQLSRLQNISISPELNSAQLERLSGLIEKVKGEIATVTQVRPIEVTATVDTSAVKQEIQDATKVSPVQIQASVNTDGIHQELKEATRTQPIELSVDVNTSEVKQQLEQASKVAPIQIKANVDTSEVNEKLGQAIKPVAVEVSADDGPLQAKAKEIDDQFRFKRYEAVVDGNTKPLEQKLSDVGKPVTIEVNTTEAQTQVNRLAETLETLEGRLGAKKELIRFETDTTKLAAANKEIQDLEKEVARLKNIGKTGFDALGNRIDVFGNALNNLQRRSGAATNAMIDLSRIVQDAPFGFLAISNNLNPALESFQRLQKESGGIKGALKSLGSSLLGAGGLGFALSAASTLLITFGDKLFGASEAEKKLQQQTQQTRDRIAELTKSISEIKIDIAGEVAGSTEGEIAKISALSKVVLDTAASYDQRNRALKELQAINKNYFGDLTLESDKLKELKGRVDEYTQALAAAAVVKAFQEDIGKVGKELALANEKARQTQIALHNLAGEFDQTGKPRKEIHLLTPEQSSEANKLKTLLSDQQSDVLKLTETYNLLQDQIQQAILLSLKFKPLQTDGGGTKAPKEKFNFFNKFFDLTPPKNEVEKQTLEMFETARDFAQKNVGLFTVKVGEKFIDLSELTRIGDRREVVDLGKRMWASIQEGLIKFKPPKIDLGELEVEANAKPVDNGADFFNAFQNSQNASGFQKDALKSVFDVPDRTKLFSEYADSFQKIGQTLPEFVEIRDVFGNLQTMNLSDAFGNFQNINFQGLVEALQKAFKTAQDSTERFITDTKTALKDFYSEIFTKGLSAVGEALGNIFSGQGIGNIFQKFGQVLGGALDALGERFIQLGVLAQLAKLSLDTLFKNPLAEIAVGIAFKALASQFKNFTVPGFAAGGLVFGPTMGLVGEGVGTSRSNPEVIAPLDKLKSFINPQGGAQHVIVTGRIRGNDILLSNQRQLGKNHRNG